MNTDNIGLAFSTIRASDLTFNGLLMRAVSDTFRYQTYNQSHNTDK